MDKDLPSSGHDRRLSALSSRQQQCLEGVLALKRAKRIAHDLGISESAVEKHLSQARGKLGVASTTEAAQIFASLRGGEIPQSGISYLAQLRGDRETEAVLRLLSPEQLQRVEDIHHGVLPHDHSLTPLQTMSTIVALSIASIIALLLLISCARAIESIVTG
jgi:DNA-binding CsgD family transcriptional regulator